MRALSSRTSQRTARAASTPIRTACSARTRRMAASASARSGPPPTTVVVHPAARTATGARQRRAGAHRPRAGCSRASFGRRRAAARYELEVAYPDGDDVSGRATPTRFPPTLGELDLHLAGEGRHEQLYDAPRRASARPSTASTGVRFAVWAPERARRSASSATSTAGTGACTRCARSAPAGSGSCSCPDVARGRPLQVRDPHADGELRAQGRSVRVPGGGAARHRLDRVQPPATLARRRLARRACARRRGSPRAALDLRGPPRLVAAHARGRRPLGYRELGDQLAAYVARPRLHARRADAGDGAPVRRLVGLPGDVATSRPIRAFGIARRLARLRRRLHQAGIGVILDWVPAHFPRDDWALARFDGTALYEHADPRRGAHPDWGTLVFNYGRHEVRNFLLANALFWLREYHADGLRVDAVASMLYLDYSRRAGEWVPNEYGGREDLEAIAFLRELNEVAHGRVPGVDHGGGGVDGVAGRLAPDLPRRPRLRLQVEHGLDARHPRSTSRRTRSTAAHHHHELTFSMIYAFSENFILPLSHDEVVHGKGSLLGEDARRPLAALREPARAVRLHVGASRQEAAVHGPGVRAGGASGATSARSTGTCSSSAEHAGVQHARARPQPPATAASRRCGGATPSPTGFAGSRRTTRTRTSSPSSALARCTAHGSSASCNLSPVVRERLPRRAAGRRRVARAAQHRLARSTAGSTSATAACSTAEPHPWHEPAALGALTLPPLGVIWLVPAGPTPLRAPAAA